MGINSESDIAANLQIGPTDQGMVRIYVEGTGVDLPLDFDPEEAEEIAEELMAAAEAEARRRGCITIVLDTHSFQAPDLYPALGYEKVGETIDTPAGHTQIMFQKRL